MNYTRTEISKQDIDAQKSVMEKVRIYNEEHALTPLAFVDTYGCQQNEADSEKLRGMLAEMGYGFTGDEKAADVIVINTCAIREHAEMRVLGNVGALTHTKRANPNQIIILCGCMMQQPAMAEKIRKSFRHVDIVFGPHALWRFPTLLSLRLEERGRIFDVDDMDGAIYEGLPVQRDGGVKAWLSVMYGCNNFCSYCVVPHVRGRERSRDPEIIVEEAKSLIADGYKDITLLGQNVNSYGNDADFGLDFAGLIRRINSLDGDFLIRFMTSHPKDAGENLFRTMAECEKAAKHIHLPFQSGNDRILRAMNRGYTKESYLRLIDCAKKYIPDVVLTSDVIVGFPGETEEEFEDTLSLMEEVRFDALFTFIYSRRPGTPAAEMPDPFSKEEKQRRFERLLETQNRISEEKHAAYAGSVHRVLVDGLTEDERYPLSARTSGGRLVRITGDASLVGSFAQVKITHSNTWALYGELV